jgi:TRAP-type transport system periplasmic protein
MRIACGRSARVLILLAVASVLALPGAAFAQKKFNFGYDQPRSAAYGIAADIFDAKLMELSGGKLGIN